MISSPKAALALCVAALALVTGAAAGTPAANKAFTAHEVPIVKNLFKKKAPKLVFQKLSCITPANGSVVRCTARFTYPPAKWNIVYSLKITVHDATATAGAGENLVTTGIRCSEQKTGRKVSCSG